MLSFASAPFKSTTVVTPKVKTSPLTSLMKPVLAFFLLLIVLFLLWRSSRRARKAALANDALLDSLFMEQLGAASIGPVTGELPAVPYVPANNRQGPTVQEIVDAQTEDVAAVLREWLHQPS